MGGNPSSRSSEGAKVLVLLEASGVGSRTGGSRTTGATGITDASSGDKVGSFTGVMVVVVGEAIVGLVDNPELGAKVGGRVGEGVGEVCGLGDVPGHPHSSGTLSDMEQEVS